MRKTGLKPLINNDCSTGPSPCNGYYMTDISESVVFLPCEGNVTYYIKDHSEELSNVRITQTGIITATVQGIEGDKVFINYGLRCNGVESKAKGKVKFCIGPAPYEMECSVVNGEPGDFTIYIEGGQGEFLFEVTDKDNVLHAIGMFNTKIRISELPPGNYDIKVVDRNGCVTYCQVKI